jgi:antitoxin component of RelBE/YafQ-DinJ toxin-antitoxin module
MTEQIRLRIDKRLAREAEVVCRKLGITPTAADSMFFAQIAWRLLALRVPSL